MMWGVGPCRSFSEVCNPLLSCSGRVSPETFQHRGAQISGDEIFCMKLLLNVTLPASRILMWFPTLLWNVCTHVSTHLPNYTASRRRLLNHDTATIIWKPISGYGVRDDDDDDDVCVCVCVCVWERERERESYLNRGTRSVGLRLFVPILNVASCHEDVRGNVGVTPRIWHRTTWLRCRTAG